MITEGDTFQPCPKSLAHSLPVPSVAMPPLPFSPVKFSGLMERLFALDNKDRLFRPKPLNVINIPLSKGFTARRHIAHICFFKRLMYPKQLCESTKLKLRTWFFPRSQTSILQHTSYLAPTLLSVPSAPPLQEIFAGQPLSQSDSL